jgi:hypothetical protein
MNRSSIRVALAVAIVVATPVVSASGAGALGPVPPNGCLATAPVGVDGVSGALGCAYTAGGPGAYLAATPNGWTITITRAGAVVATIASASGAPPAGTLATMAGDSVTLTVDPACNPADASQCGAAGTLAAGDRQ